LLKKHNLTNVLCLGPEQVDYLINTRQILPIRIAGEELFDRRDLERLVDTYKATAARRLK
jgi:hypothetical protein